VIGGGAAASKGAVAAARRNEPGTKGGVVSQQPADHLLRLGERRARGGARLIDVAGLERPVDRHEALHDVVVQLERLAPSLGSASLHAVSSTAPRRSACTARTAARTSPIPAGLAR
jgi:hypothetical protein